MTETIALHTRLKPGAEEEYEMAHANIPRGASGSTWGRAES